ncbi:helix-turn-helix domain-containing protein [Streptomyces zagrosensis]|uniref:DNA-binding Lrp family transcriptional regulator n=1 Tax=Streptomyces zagrosensis TaxID=1042984 RepID=A0A7W9QH56_9ACTN|nr:helix-turn-helix domain-containing protein [Streptomyces zagrosensis]MBB5939859.1 DNA-binding Lrp family transcriptional regulator [Streptomyces zagrosensis]
MTANEPGVSHSTMTIRLYQHALREGGIEPQHVAEHLRIPAEEAATAIAELRELGLLRRLSIADHRLVAMNPQTAAAERLGPREHCLREEQSRLALQRSAIEAFMPVHLETTMGKDPAEGIEIVEGPDLVDKTLTDLIEACQTEACVIQPFGLRTQRETERGLPAHLAMLGRGVRQRTLCQHSTRYSTATKQAVAAISAAGAEVRTLDVLPPQMVVFDCSQAVLTSLDDGDTAVVIRNAAAARYFASVFEVFWLTAAPFPGVGPGERDREISRDIDAAIIRLLATGAKDEVIARRLGVSLRTCRRRIAHLMDDIGADSRFQAGYLARQYAGERQRQEARAGSEAVEPALSVALRGLWEEAVRVS